MLAQRFIERTILNGNKGELILIHTAMIVNEMIIICRLSIPVGDPRVQNANKLLLLQEGSKTAADGNKLSVLLQCE